MSDAATCTPIADTAFVGRQPILDAGRGLYGYELLFRDGENQHAGVSDGDRATAQVMANALMEIGLDSVVGPHLAFINLTRDTLLESGARVLPRERVVLEVLEDVAIDEKLIAAVADFANQGYTVALDDFVYQPSWDPLIELAKIVKLDVMALGMEEVRQHVELLKPRGVKLLAEKVETQDEFDAFLDMGFDYFQGFFFAKPSIIRGRKMPSSRISSLRLLAQLNDPSAEVDDIEHVVGQDAALSYRLLRYINSATFALRREVQSIRQAVVYLGLSQLRRWASLVVMASHDDKPAALMQTILVRARMCELLCAAASKGDRDAFFTAGLFSGLDALVDAPLPEVIANLSLTDELRTAILNHAGAAGRAVACAMEFERGQWSGATFFGLDTNEIRSCYAEAVSWSLDLEKELA